MDEGISITGEQFRLIGELFQIMLKDYSVYSKGKNLSEKQTEAYICGWIDGKTKHTHN